MPTLLHISASPRGDQSESLALARTFLDGVRASRPEVETAHWDLWDGTLPEFGPDFAHAKMAVFAGHEFSGRQAAAWDRRAANVRAIRRRPGVPVLGPPAASLVEANRIEGVQAIGRQAEHSADAVCRVAYAS
jgi:hypothetical protein